MVLIVLVVIGFIVIAVGIVWSIFRELRIHQSERDSQELFREVTHWQQSVADHARTIGDRIMEMSSLSRDQKAELVQMIRDQQTLSLDIEKRLTERIRDARDAAMDRQSNDREQVNVTVQNSTGDSAANQAGKNKVSKQ